MALTLEAAGKVRQKAYSALLNSDRGTTTGAGSTAAFYALKAFFLWWSSNKSNADLQFIPFSNITSADPGIAQNTGYSPIAGVTSTVHFLWARNDGTGDGTDSFISLHNSTTNTNVDLAYVTGLISDDNDSFFFVSIPGIVFATDLTISAATTNGGQTESAAANAANGFVIVAA